MQRSKNGLNAWHSKMAKMGRVRFKRVGFFSRQGFFPPHNIIISSRLFTSFYFVCYGNTVLAWGPSVMPTSPWDSWLLHRNDVTFYAYQSKMMLLFMLIRVCRWALLRLSECAETLISVLLKTNSFFCAVCPVGLLYYMQHKHAKTTKVRKRSTLKAWPAWNSFDIVFLRFALSSEMTLRDRRWH